MMRALAAWALQMGASSSWIISVIIYDSWETGDVFQMLAACMWTLSNLLSLPDALLSHEQGSRSSARAPAPATPALP